jgi:hypothetical protein
VEVGISFLSRVREVERPGDDDFFVDDHHLVVGDCMSRIDMGTNASSI